MTVAAAISPCEWPIDHVRLDAVGAPQLGQRDHDRPQRGLDHVHPVQAGGAGPPVAARRRRRVVRCAARGRPRTRRRARRRPATRPAARGPSPATASPARGRRTPAARRSRRRASDVVVRPATGQRVAARPRLASRSAPEHHRPVLEDRPGSAPDRPRSPRDRPPAPPPPRRAARPSPAAPAARATAQAAGTDASPRARHGAAWPAWRWCARAPACGAGGMACGGGSARTRWQLVPPMPNELTPATSGRSPPGQGAVSRTTRRLRSASGIAGFGGSKCRLGGQLAVLDGEHHLEQAGDAGGALQVADVGLHRADQQRLARPAGRRRSAAPSAAASIGSPTGVPVPCSSTYWTSAGSTPARRAGQPEHLLLGPPAGHGEPVAAAVVVDRAAADHARAPGRRRPPRPRSGLSTTTPPPSPRT